MNDWSGDLLHSLTDAPDEHALFERVLQVALELGFEQCAYGLRAPLPVSNPKTILISNYSAEWRQRYLEAEYIRIDPTVHHGRRSQVPIVWTDSLFAGAPALWSEARSSGLCVGRAQSSFDARGVGGLLTLSRSQDPLSENELRAKNSQMSWLANVAHFAFSRLLAPRINPLNLAALTKREIEVLKWTADGKTSFDTAEILNVEVDTVNFHLKNAVAKLGASNRTSAVVQAVSLGLLN